MDLGIRGKRAIVCASSRGLGRACAESLAREGVHVTLNGRDAAALDGYTPGAVPDKSAIEEALGPIETAKREGGERRQRRRRRR